MPAGHAREAPVAMFFCLLYYLGRLFPPLKSLFGFQSRAYRKSPALIVEALRFLKGRRFHTVFAKISPRLGDLLVW
jgi:hypothetical protein